mgnify:FL=1
MLGNTLRRNKGITLIALVVTVIVLLILAGISIAMLTGQNGILNRAAEAKEKTRVAQEDENEKLQGYEDIMAQYTGSLPSREKTKPYFPNSTFSYKEGDLSTGLVIKDSNDNEYVWVEVPKTIYSDSKYNAKGIPGSADDWEQIRDCLKAYTVDYSDSSYKDTNTDGTTYSDDYKNMLKSVYTNGGFWIGRYEAGLEGDTPRTSYTEISASDKAVVKQNKIPYNYVTRDEAQELATRMNYNGCTSSLIFGIQWDLTLKYIEEKTVELAEEANKDTVRADIKNKLTSNSKKIGNYYNSEFTLNRGKFAKYNELSDWKAYNSEEKPTLVTGSQKKEQSSSENGILLTTGATKVTSLQNIYDIAGNLWEWTREFYSTSGPCVDRGGSYGTCGSNTQAKYRSGTNISHLDGSVGFRIGLWKQP